MELILAIAIGAFLCYLGKICWKEAKFIAVCLYFLGIFGPIMYFETGPGSHDNDKYYEDDDEEYFHEDVSNHSSNISFQGRTSDIKGECEICDDCYQYDGVNNQGYWPKCSCGHTYGGHKTK